jgi:hypothetical protein
VAEALLTTLKPIVQAIARAPTPFKIAEVVADAGSSCALRPTAPLHPGQVFYVMREEEARKVEEELTEQADAEELKRARMYRTRKEVVRFRTSQLRPNKCFARKRKRHIELGRRLKWRRSWIAKGNGPGVRAESRGFDVA